MTDVLVDLEGSVLLVTLNRPGQLNALSLSAVDELCEAWYRAREPDVRALVVTGAGQGFCAGADLKTEPRPTGDPIEPTLRDHFHRHVLALAGLRKPVIAAVNGVAAGAGLALACTCDIRLAATTARFAPAFLRIGATPDSGASYFLPRVIGYARALQWLCTARIIDAPTAREWNLVTELCAPGDLIGRAMALANEMAQFPAYSIGATKQLLAGGLARTLAEQLEHEIVAQRSAYADSEATDLRTRFTDELVQRRDAHDSRAGSGSVQQATT